MTIERRGRNLRGIGTKGWQALLLSCTALAAISATSAMAQDAGSVGSGTELETIVIEGSGNGADNDARSIVATQATGTGKMPAPILTTPASVSVITSKELKERGAESVEQAVQYTAGVVTDFYGSDDRYDYFDIRGFTPYTYRDGLAIGRTFGAAREEPYAFERIEVLKGASSAGFGAAEPGGSVNYVTKLPKSERFGEVYGTVGSFAHKETGFDFGDNITEDDTLSYRLTGKFQDADAEYDYSQNDEKFIMGGLTWRPTDLTSLSFVFDHLNTDGVPGSGGQPIGTDFDRDRFFGEPDYYFRTTNRNTYSMMFDHDFGNGLSFGSNARYMKSGDTFGSAYLSNTRTDGSSISDRYYFGNDKSSEQFVVDANLMYETQFHEVKSRTLAGIDYNNFNSQNFGLYIPVAPPINWLNPVYAGGPPSTAPNSGTRTDQTTNGIYLQQELTFSDRLTASLGLRNDWLDLSETNLFTGVTTAGDYSEFTSRFGLSYKITEELAAYASYAESVAPPGVGSEPTTGKQYEVGIKYQPEAFPALFTASVYDLTKGNITVFDSVTYLPDTVEKVRHRGIELEARAEITDNIGLIAAYSYIDSKIDEPGGANNGNRLMRVPEHLASIWGTYTLPGNGVRGDMTFGLGARYTDSYFTDIANTISSESAVVFDASFTYEIRENTTLQLNASNLFDEKHVASQDSGGVYYSPGRAIYATLRQTW
ncbi:iron complex outermembrane receptor protein [Pseudorhizobium tarimense]|uniref:Iron complex outermembrane receptor protein n=1 Tax=Pseudorhizobium tarimense TaxID=1079109 RepID=A0ABV2H0S1_9HYPH|nr:TonB-dependent siderophore receptor [Pseudorhizobium tarimense]MCJ8517460.1 TonB-dependent siderophore receptor [Pseudorhizobium tarimense]